MKRGEVRWAHLPGPVGRRPVLLLSRDEAYRVRELITVVPLTTRIRRIPTEVALGPAEGLPKECVANLDGITTIPKRALRDEIATLDPEKMKKAEDAIRFALALGR